MLLSHLCGTTGTYYLGMMGHKFISILSGPRHTEGPARGGSHVTRLNFKTSRVGVNKMLVAYCRLCRHCHNLNEGGCLDLVVISFYTLLLLFGPCHLSEFTLAGPHNGTLLY